ncbi:LPKTxAVK-anchored surface protein [Streptococcus pluranimalium]|uniref:LPKTxAVK-anchored surface protein n=1 Tax=Streptococcus pluranimalium TaxID=82348 RepID=UPI003F66D550
MKKSIISLMAAATLFAAAAPVFADDNYELKAEYVDENGNATEVYYEAQNSEWTGEEPVKGDVYTVKLEDGTVVDIPWVNNKVTLPDGTVVERPAVATADGSGKKEAQAVKAAATIEASKALPKTSAVK